jgi:hypothetical protein
MSARVTILDFEINPHGRGLEVIRFFIPGDIHVDFIMPLEVQDGLAREIGALRSLARPGVVDEGGES